VTEDQAPSRYTARYVSIAPHDPSVQLQTESEAPSRAMHTTRPPIRALMYTHPPSLMDYSRASAANGLPANRSSSCSSTVAILLSFLAPVSLS